MAKANPQHLREYETVFLVRPEITDDGVEQLKNRVRDIVNREGGKMLQFTSWGKKKTQYLVAKQPRATYIHGHYLGKPTLVAEVERNLRNLDEVTRFLSVKLADEVDPSTRDVKPDAKLQQESEEREKAPREDPVAEEYDEA